MVWVLRENKTGEVEMLIRHPMRVITWNQYSKLKFRGGFYRSGKELCVNVLVPYGEDIWQDTLWVAVIRG
jgi:hypothetical protein